jgi:hypothetical protein
MNTNEAVSMARCALTSLGYDLHRVFADQPPQVVAPPVVRNNVVPVYRIQWASPLGIRPGDNVIDVEVNADSKSVAYMSMLASCFYRPPPEIGVPEPTMGSEKTLSISASNHWGSIVLPEISKFASCLNLETKSPVKPEYVERFVRKNDSYFFVKLKDHFRFWYENGEIFSFAAPDAIYLSPSSDPQLPIEVYTGEWKLDEKAAAQVVVEAVLKLGYSMVNGVPVVSKPNQIGNYIEVLPIV